MSTPLERALTFAHAIVAATTPGFDSPAHIVATALIEAEKQREQKDTTIASQAAEIKRLEGKVKACHNRIDDDTETIERQAALMRKALEKAPHSVDCVTDFGQRSYMKCNCWKAALAQVSASPKEEQP